MQNERAKGRGKRLFAYFQQKTAYISRNTISEAGLSADKLRGAKKMNQREWAQLNEAIGRLEKAPMSIDITGSISVHEFRAKARRLVSREHVKLIMNNVFVLPSG